MPSGHQEVMGSACCLVCRARRSVCYRTAGNKTATGSVRHSNSAIHLEAAMSGIASPTRREFLAGTAAVIALARDVHAQAAAGPFKLEPLPYPNNALEPHIDARTMEIHHDRHHAAYVMNLNNALKDHPAVASMSLQDILAKLGEMPEAIRTVLRNNGGGHANHTMFWQVMGPAGGQPQGELAAAITRDLGGLQKLPDDFYAPGLPGFGPGSAVLTVHPHGQPAHAT